MLAKSRTKIKYIIYDAWFAHSSLRFIAGVGGLFVALVYGISGVFLGGQHRFRYFDALCWVYRVADIKPLNRFLAAVIGREVRRNQHPKMSVIQSYEHSSRARKIRAYFGEGIASRDRVMRHMLVLKEAKEGEKGVIVLKFAEALEAFLLLFDFNKIAERYNLVIEMSSAGVCDPSYLLFSACNCHVFILSSDPQDHSFLHEIGANLLGVPLGSGDWANPNLGIPKGKEKRFDIVMVANWSYVKNHRMLFRALEMMDLKESLSVLLIGFPWGCRTHADVKREYCKHVIRNRAKIDLIIKERVSHPEVLTYLSESRVSVLLSYKEGANKAVSESLLCNTPVVLYDGMAGGTKCKINPKTGLLSSFKDLYKVLQFMIGSHDAFTPAEYYLMQSGSKNATRILNTELKSRNANWTTDIVERVNDPFLNYADSSMGARFQIDVEFIKSAFRN